MEPAFIADNLLVNATTKEEIPFKELWKDKTCVIVFFRRFG